MTKIKLILIIVLSMAVGAAGGALAYHAYTDVPDIYPPYYQQETQDFVEKVFSDTATEKTYPLIAEDAESLKKLITYRQAWCKEQGISDYELLSSKLVSRGFGQSTNKRNFETTLQTEEQYRKPNGEIEEVECHYQVFFEIRDGEWRITKAIANDRAGSHFFPQIKEDKVYFFENFDDDVAKIGESMKK